MMSAGFGKKGILNEYNPDLSALLRNWMCANFKKRYKCLLTL